MTSPFTAAVAINAALAEHEPYSIWTNTSGTEKRDLSELGAMLRDGDESHDEWRYEKNVLQRRTVGGDGAWHDAWWLDHGIASTVPARFDSDDE